MFNIPKFAKGGIITSPPQTILIGEKSIDKDTISGLKQIDKYFVIYNRTKKARIKKKAAKKSWILALKRGVEKPIKIKLGGTTNELPNI